MIDVQWEEIRIYGRGTASAFVSFLPPGCKRRRLAKFEVRLAEDKILVSETYGTMKEVPKRIRDQLGEGGREWIRAECARLFAKHGLESMKASIAEMDRNELEIRRQRAVNLMKRAADQALELGFEMSDLENLLRESVAKKVMEG